MYKLQVVSRGFMPSYATPGAAGMDLCAAETVMLHPGETQVVSTGLKMAIPVGFEGQVRSRSGLAKRGIVVANSPGTIDSDYRGEVGVILRNTSDLTYTISPGDRIAQLVIARAERFEPVQVLDLDATERGAGGFGSTGV